jgi:glycosyltransferase involved in cell wall biosynthesis
MSSALLLNIIMTICFFGYPNETYSRNQILIDGLKKNGTTVIFCTDKSGLFVTRYWKLFKKFIKLRDQTDIIFVQFPGHLNVPIAWLLGKLFRKPVIFDAFVSLYDTYIFDRQVAHPDSLKAKFYWWVDKLTCTLADHVTLDTYAHIRYFIRTFKLSRSKFSRLPVGGDDSVFKPRATRHVPRAKVVVEFHGMFTRIHGAEIFVEAAKKLERHKNLEFWLIGSSDNYQLPIKLYRKLKPKTMKYWPSMPVAKLARKIAQADISIAHLGPTQKAKMVLTNKMFHALASRIALIAGDNPATKEFLTDKQTCLLVKMYDAEDLAQKILFLSKNKQLRRQIANNGYQLHQTKFTNQKIALKLLQIIRKHLLHIGAFS